jgi:hypothetical protein
MSGPLRPGLPPAAVDGHVSILSIGVDVQRDRKSGLTTALAVRTPAARAPDGVGRPLLAMRARKPDTVWPKRPRSCGILPSILTSFPSTP